MTARLLLIAIFFALNMAGQPGQDRDPGATDAAGYVLGPEDVISIRALHATEISEKTYLVNSSGQITVPMVGALRAGGLSVEQLERAISAKLSEYIKDPQVSVMIVEHRSQPVSVLGAVTKPGVYQIRGRRTLLEVLSMAEGLKADAAQTVQITRRKEYGPIPRLGAKEEDGGEVTVATVNIAAVSQGRDPAGNILIKPHDVLSVPVAEKIYVLGLVTKPGPIGLTDGRTISVLEALSAAGGPTPMAAMHKARILRKTPGSSNRSEVAVNLSKVLEGQNTDLVLGPDDVLYVPNNAARSASMRAIEAALQAATGMAIWWPRN
jgi:polysaccharide export outer membrane protein